jgi:hypothetical protein
MKFTIYNVDGSWSGTFTTTGDLDPAMVPDGGHWIEGAHDRFSRWENDQVVLFTQSEIDAAEIEEAWPELRRERNRRLSVSDWTQTMDAPVDRAAWAAYRQTLRDLPANTADPRAPQWPSPPA